jgi:hypothetical protein
MELTNLTNGFIRFEAREDDVGHPEFFMVTFNVACLSNEHQIPMENSFEVAVPVLSDNRAASYSDIEQSAAQALPAFFRELADLIEADLVRVDRQRQGLVAT